MVPHIDYVLRECVECLKQRLAEQSRPPFLRLADFKEQLRAEIDAWNEKLPPVESASGSEEDYDLSILPLVDYEDLTRTARAQSGNDDGGEGTSAAGAAHELSEPGRLDRMVEDLEVPDHICILPSICMARLSSLTCQASGTCLYTCLYTCLCTHVYTCLCTCPWARHRG